MYSLLADHWFTMHGALSSIPPTDWGDGKSRKEKENNGDAGSKEKGERGTGWVGKRREELRRGKGKDREELFHFAQSGDCKAKVTFPNFPQIKRE